MNNNEYYLVLVSLTCLNVDPRFPDGSAQFVISVFLNKYGTKPLTVLTTPFAKKGLNINSSCEGFIGTYLGFLRVKLYHEFILPTKRVEILV